MTYTILNTRLSASPCVYTAKTADEVNAIVRGLWADPDYSIDTLPEDGVRILRHPGKPSLAILPRGPL